MCADVGVGFADGRRADAAGDQAVCLTRVSSRTTQEDNAMGKGLLFASFDFSAAHEDEFHDWYDLEHIPERQRVPGFLACERWIGEENPKIAVATYDLQALSVLRSPAYLAIGGDNLSVWSKRVTAMCQRIMRYEGEQLLPGDAAAPAGAGALLVASMNVDPSAEHEFNEWYNTEHLPQLAAVPGVLCARRFGSQEADRERQYLAMYHLTGPDVPNSDSWKKAAGTPWTERMRPHFRDLLRIRCKRYVRA
jgi:hypothetical protein